jgi:hypothetical protein
VRLSDDLRKAVVFLGVRTPDKNGNMEFHGAGTGFWLSYDGWSHLVTCRHVAKSLDAMPFDIRCNNRSGEVAYAEVEKLDWFFHPDKNVDVAAVPLGLGTKADWLVIATDLILSKEDIDKRHIGIGDMTYVVGLFRLLQGTKRNLPVVHTGNIALMPGDDPLPVWSDSEDRPYEVEGYLVEANSIDGLSGSPVFVRNTYHLDGADKKVFVCGDPLLLGMWQSAWGGEPSKELAENYGDRGEKLTVPVGLGIVVPADKIVEVLEMPEMKKERQKRKEDAMRSVAAKTQSAPIARAADTASADVDETGHRERFKSLLDAAVRPPKSSD